MGPGAQVSLGPFGLAVFSVLHAHHTAHTSRVALGTSNSDKLCHGTMLPVQHSTPVIVTNYVTQQPATAAVLAGLHQNHLWQGKQDPAATSAISHKALPYMG